MANRQASAPPVEATAHFPPHPVQRAIIALALGVLLGGLAALLRPRHPAEDEG